MMGYETFHLFSSDQCLFVPQLIEMFVGML